MKKIKVKFSNILVIIMLFISMGCLWKMLTKATTGVSGFYWIVPFVFTMCLVLFPFDVKLHEGGIGVKILFGVMIVRYCISPLLNTMTNLSKYGTTETIWSIVYQCIEIISVFLGLKLFYRNEEKRVINKLKRKSSEHLSSKLTYSGIAIMLFLCMIMILRGNGDEIWDAARFFLATDAIENKAYDSYSIIALLSMKSMLFIALVQLFSDKNKKNHRKIWPCLGCVVAAINFMIYFGNNRSSVIQCALASIMVLLILFEDDKKFILSITIPILILIAISLIFLKNFGIDITSQTNSTTISLKEIANTIDLYFCGINNGASEQARYIMASKDMHIGSFFRDITNNIFLFKIPGLTFVDSIFSNYPTTSDLVTQGSTAMLSLSGQLTMYCGRILGLIADIAVQFIMIKILSKLDNIVKYSKNVGTVYISAWLASLIGMLPMYCLITILWSASNTPFFLWLLIKVNNWGHKHKLVVRY